MSGAGMDYGQMGQGGPSESSLPWQERARYASSLAAMWRTVKLVLFEPSTAFSRVQVEGSLGGSMLFVVILGTVGAVFSAFWQVLAHAAGFAGAFAEEATHDWIVLVGGAGVAVVLWVILAPLFTLIGSLIGAAILHVCLWLLGGVTQTFEATYAVVAYASGATAVFNLIPLCGGFVAAVWVIVLEIIGLSRVHNTSTGRAALAVFLPMIVCCGLGAVALIIFAGAAAAGAA